MIYEKSEFKLILRNAKKTLLLVPGWATDYRIFGRLDLGCNYLLPTKISLCDFEDELLKTLEENAIGKLSILGWSMGGFMASGFATKYRDRIDELILMSVRRGYEKEEIDNIKTYLKKSRRGYLFKFYNECFSDKEQDAFSWFRKNLMRSYLDEMDMEFLMDGLEYLSNVEIKSEILKGLKIKFTHGEEDKIAPIGKALAIKEELPQAEFIRIEGTGHMPFLQPRLSAILMGGSSQLN